MTGSTKIRVSLAGPVLLRAAARYAAVPPLATPIPVGDGVALLKRRPDVRAAERVLAADTVRIGVATGQTRRGALQFWAWAIVI